jgi:hypothetical protein
MFVNFALRCPSAADKFKILAKVAGGLFQKRLRTAFAALLRHAWIVMRAIQADSQIRAAFHACLAAPRLAVQRPRLAAIVAMPHHFIFDLRFAVDDFKMILNGYTIRLRFNVQSWQADKFRLTLIPEL